jgi:hypothetical protein
MHGLERGDPAEVLLEAARDAELLVLGNHGRGALAGRWSMPQPLPTGTSGAALPQTRR